MRKYLCLMAVVLFSLSSANARPLERQTTNSPALRLAETDLSFCDKDRDGYLTLDEYKMRGNRRMSRSDRTNEKVAKRKKYYKSPEVRFKEMDSDNDGKISLRDMEAYYSVRRASGEELY